RKYPYFAEQSWSNILCLHWPVDVELIRPYVPKPFLIDLFNDKAWVTIVVFRAKESLFRSMPTWTAYPPVTQINVRTYVKHPKSPERGIYFFSLLVNSFVATYGARSLFGLPFYSLTNTYEQIHHNVVVNSFLKGSHIFSVHYKPKDHLIQDDLAYFLSERYCIWNIHRHRIIKIPVHHSNWTLQDVQVQVKENQLVWDKDAEFFAHYSPFKHTKLYPFETYGYYG
ncbi:MAG TPA: DUF2071 domain-containing protein, partial [Pseudogracilibacillus sp.]|nr:DUF2071 domain-containing protein [Pseudogracilibacillus sp.]